MQRDSDSIRLCYAHSRPPSIPKCDLPSRLRGVVWAVGLTAASLAAAPAATSNPAAHPPRVGGEGSISPILNAHLSAKDSTSFVVEIAANAEAPQGYQVIFFELRAPQPGAARPLDYRRRLVGSRFLTKSVAAPGETLSLSLPRHVFGSVHAVAALVIQNTGASGVIAMQSVRLPKLDPALTVPVPPAPGSIVVTEFMKDPMAVSDFAGEWLELQNRSSAAVDLEGWTLRDDGSNRTVIVSQAPGGNVNVPPGGLLVLGRNGDASINGGVPVDVVYSGFTLGNGADQIILEAPGGFVIDRVDYLDAGVDEWPDASGASIALSPRFTGTPAAAFGAAWCSGTATLPSGDLGSPGTMNSDCGG